MGEHLKQIYDHDSRNDAWVKAQKEGKRIKCIVSGSYGPNSYGNVQICLPSDYDRETGMMVIQYLASIYDSWDHDWRAARKEGQIMQCIVLDDPKGGKVSVCL